MERPTRDQRADAGTVRPSARDTEALAWVVEMYGMPLDLIRERYGMSDSAARNMVARWRRAAWVDTGSFGDLAVPGAARAVGPMWVWATATGIERFGRHPYAANMPSAARVRHIRAAVVTRIAFDKVYADQAMEWRSERELRWEIGRVRGAEAARGHVPDAELAITTPQGSRLRYAVEVELTPKSVERTKAIMQQLIHEGVLGTPYATVSQSKTIMTSVYYLVTPEARPVVTRAREMLGKSAAAIDIQDLPAGV